MGPVIIESERLNLRTWTPDDVVGIVDIFSDPKVARFINDGKPVPAEKAGKFIERYERTQRERGWCRWVLELREEPGKVAGFCGVGCTFAPDIELGWTLRRELWGRGLATEAARVALAYCFDTVGFKQVVSAIDPANVRSAAVAERLGMVPTGELEYEGKTLVRYAIDNPNPSVTPSPGMIASCDGEPAGGILDETREA